jgi:outer membrane protein assembly factor BamB
MRLVEVLFMRRLVAFTAPFLILASTVIGSASREALRAATAPRPGVDWPQFRGIAAAGIAEGFSLPTTWNAADATNIIWRTPVPGLGLSSPVVWGDDVFISTSISGKTDAGLKVGLYGDIASVQDDTEHEWRIYALDKRTGKIKWQQSAYKGVPKVKRHPKSSHANSTLATDGERVVALFGSEGLYAYDLKGKLLWKKDLGLLDAAYYVVPAAQWETGSSPVLHDGKVVIQADVLKGSFLAMFDAKDGREVWRVPRTDVPTWSTPTIHQVNGRTQILVNGMRQVGGYDFQTGKEIWTLSGGGDIPVPTPVASEGLVYITNAHGARSPVYAIRETAAGDVSLESDQTSNEGVAWSTPRGGGYICTPLIYQGLAYVIRYNGVLNVFDAKTGEKKYEQRLAGATSAFTSSPVANDGRVYVASEDGQVFVLKAGPTYEVIAMNEMATPILATPAISEGRLLLRTQNQLMAIGARRD